MHVRTSYLTAIFTAILSISPATAEPWRQYTLPAEAGWSASALEEAREFAEKRRSGAAMLVYRGDVVLAWGDVERRFKCHSVRKSVLSALFGTHVAQGRIDIQRTIADLGIDDLQPLSESEKSARVVDLLSARSGVYHLAAKSPSDMSANLPERGSHAPGTFWYYNNWDFNTLGTIFERAAGTSIFDDFTDRFAEPLGMEDWRRRDGYYELEPRRSRYPAYAFRLSARDLARFGQLFLQRGRWNGRPIVPESWIDESTAGHSDLGGGRGYGYMWWIYPAGTMNADHYPTLNRFDKYAASGTGGQFVLVVPEAECVFVHRGDTDNNRRVPGRVVWELAERCIAAKTGEPESAPKLGPLSAIPFKNAAAPPPERVAVPLASESLENYPGRYRVSDALFLEIFAHDGRLFVDLHHPNGMDERELVPESQTRFWVVNNPNNTVTFELNAAKVPTGLRFKSGPVPFKAKRVDPEV